MKNKEIKIKEIIKSDKKIVKKHINYIILFVWIYFIIFIIVGIIGFNSDSGILYDFCYSNTGTIGIGYNIIILIIIIIISFMIILPIILDQMRNKKNIIFILIFFIFFLGLEFKLEKYNKMTHLRTIKNSSIVLNRDQPIFLDKHQYDTNCYYLVTYNKYGKENLIDLEYCNPGKSKEILEKVKKLRDNKIEELGLSN